MKTFSLRYKNLKKRRNNILFLRSKSFQWLLRAGVFFFLRFYMQFLRTIVCQLRSPHSSSPSPQVRLGHFLLRSTDPALVSFRNGVALMDLCGVALRLALPSELRRTKQRFRRCQRWIMVILLKTSLIPSLSSSSHSVARRMYPFSIHYTKSVLPKSSWSDVRRHPRIAAQSPE